jgi:hypothetical protein
MVAAQHLRTGCVKMIALAATRLCVYLCSRGNKTVGKRVLCMFYD